VEAAGQVNDAMPGFVVDKLARLLADSPRPSGGTARVLLVGVTYKPDVADLREAAALRVLEQLQARGFDVCYHDPLIARLEVGGRVLESQPLAIVGEVEAVVLATPHSDLDYGLLLREARLILDTANALRHRPTAGARVVPL
jgi:UDP-N-acetyl-D-glucosamine dehydrogenase